MWLGFRHHRALCLRADSRSERTHRVKAVGVLFNPLFLHSKRNILEFVFHLGAAGLSVAGGGCHCRGSLPGHMAQSDRNLFQGKASGAQPMAEVVSQIVTGDIGDLFPLLPRGSLRDGAPPGMQPSFSNTPGMITNTAGPFVCAL